MAKSSLKGAVDRLKSLGYIVQRESSNVFDFYEVTTKDKEMDRKKVENDMIIFEDVPSPTEFPKAKPGEFTF